MQVKQIRPDASGCLILLQGIYSGNTVGVGLFFREKGNLFKIINVYTFKVYTFVVDLQQRNIHTKTIRLKSWHK